MTKKYTQTMQVIDTLRKNGGYATLGSLYHLVDTSSWGTKTPNESIRRIVQNSKDIFRTKVSHLPFYRLFQMIVSCNLQINNSLTFCKRKLNVS